MGAAAGLAAGRIAGGRAAILAAKEEVGKIDALAIDAAGIEELKAKVKQISATSGKEAGAHPGSEDDEIQEVGDEAAAQV